MKLLTIYGSSRRNGNSEALAKIALKELDNDQYHEIHLLDFHIEPIVDERHAPTGFKEVNDDYEVLAQQLMNHEVVLFVTPLYWYGMSGRLKNFIDRWSQSIRNESYDFKASLKGKKVFVIVTGGPASPITALPLVQQFQLITQFMDMEFVGYAIGKGVKPLEVLEDEESVLTAHQLGKRIKTTLSSLKTTIDPK